MAARRGKRIDFKQWNAIPLFSASISSAITTIGGSLEALALLTILRCRGYVQAHFDATVQVGDAILLTFGLGIFATDSAFAASGVPDPAAEPEFPWLWWGQIAMTSVSVAASAVNNSGWGMAAQRLEVDTKGMRKMKPRQSLLWVVESSGVSGAPVTEITFGQTRVLIGT